MATVSDSFTDTNGVQLTSHGTFWTKTSTYDPDIQSNALAPDRSGADQFVYYNDLIPGDDQYAQLKIVAVASGAMSVGPAVRMSTAAITAYFVYHNATAWELYKVVNGSYTRLDDSARTLAVNDVLYLQVLDNDLTFQINGTTVSTYTDSSSPITSGRVGLHAYDDSASHRADDWEGGDFTPPPPPAASLVMANISRRMAHILAR